MEEKARLRAEAETQRLEALKKLAEQVKKQAELAEQRARIGQGPGLPESGGSGFSPNTEPL
jgi:hypothetical protein